ncbi:MAG TPA: hypothetical protein VGN26_13950 [Armatimonadota bacterium]
MTASMAVTSRTWPRRSHRTRREAPGGVDAVMGLPDWPGDGYTAEDFRLGARASS